ncbi:FAD dependent oxidoreductase TIGR03364 [Luteibacter rhizovicinus]|uniref:FAD dependent oxidoreductase TIGR03364 n=1 Tax=Luteibacter rhizovicinus TaxID=242606 RepID=A0A4R3YXJ0_9GAMM|nr:TIGR03364 family FAD-dependent oxidoreductase [Luteibacter rhizovicinus]TCV96033.1 FAD dependent oxidoreductase TIGR03364 [Luteibacter rhizovicinus]
MTNGKTRSAIVIGAGIVGLAMARALAEDGYQVTVYERHERATGASVRNFGTIWPIGVPNGKLYERAMRSRAVWKAFCEATGEWHDPSGCLHVAWQDDELGAMEDYANINGQRRSCRMLSAAETLRLAPAVNASHLRGALFSGDEMTIDARSAIRRLPDWLEQRYGVRFNWKRPITRVDYPHTWSGRQRIASADLIVVAGGADFELLYPDLFAQQPITRCKLQMMRLAAQPADVRLGPVLCTGLSMVHYTGFAEAAGVTALRERYQREQGDLLKLGIHVMAAQNGAGEITIGDSHEYSHTVEPFDEAHINRKVLAYLERLMVLPHWELKQSWHGVYAKRTDGGTEMVLEPESGVLVVNGLGGLGMTLSFGLAEEIVAGSRRADPVETDIRTAVGA